jgi:hypothetical protein
MLILLFKRDDIITIDQLFRQRAHFFSQILSRGPLKKYFHTFHLCR